MDFKKRRLEYRHMNTNTEENVKIPEEAGHLKVKERGRTQLCQRFDLRLVDSWMMRKQISLVLATQSVLLCYGGPRTLNCLKNEYN